MSDACIRHRLTPAMRTRAKLALRRISRLPTSTTGASLLLKSSRWFTSRYVLCLSGLADRRLSNKSATASQTLPGCYPASRTIATCTSLSFLQWTRSGTAFWTVAADRSCLARTMTPGSIATCPTQQLYPLVVSSSWTLMTSRTLLHVFSGSTPLATRPTLLQQHPSQTRPPLHVPHITLPTGPPAAQTPRAQPRTPLASTPAPQPRPRRSHCMTTRRSQTSECLHTSPVPTYSYPSLLSTASCPTTGYSTTPVIARIPSCLQPKHSLFLSSKCSSVCCYEYL